MITRRSFLGTLGMGVVATAAAPAIVRADSLMKIVSRPQLPNGHWSWGIDYSRTTMSEQTILYRVKRIFIPTISVVGKETFDDLYRAQPAFLSLQCEVDSHLIIG